jgi:hypothetical protein
MRTPLRRRNEHEVEQRAADPADRGHQDADRSAHQRYYTVISRAVTEQGETTFSSREALYERARAAQASALQKYHPSLTKDNFDRERLALEQAIDRVERKARAPYGGEHPLINIRHRRAKGFTAGFQGSAKVFSFRLY